MNRREALKTTSFLSLGLLSMAPLKTLHAQALESGELKVRSEISNNHGHALILSLSELVQILQKTHKEGPVSINIQGDSRHPHQVVLDSAQSLELLLSGQISLTSSTDAGHSHAVQVFVE